MISMKTIHIQVTWSPPWLPLVMNRVTVFCTREMITYPAIDSPFNEITPITWSPWRPTHQAYLELHVITYAYASSTWVESNTSVSSRQSHSLASVPVHPTSSNRMGSVPCPKVATEKLVRPTNIQALAYKNTCVWQCIKYMFPCHFTRVWSK